MTKNDGRALVLASVISLAACTNGPPVKTLRTPEHADTITLTEPTTYTVLTGLFGNVPWSYTLQPGTYVAEKEDNAGTYFRGPAASVAVHMGNAKGPTWPHVGGIWVPRNGAASPRAYHYGGDAGSSADVDQVGGAVGHLFLAAANKAEAGKIELDPIPTDPAFATAVRAHLHPAAR
ncbi:hypothetical protein FIV34_01735 [Luteibacter pinisoli]|uniref:Uncharacterized protein n=1 Tax=Luteibacter pinisoli TaxID=2589080 RepID=A0A4Y5YYE5_9GAMM|nr:hypothetical protein [Luteibacter pinisoli]QDE38002.1 hypothetical protein FIV34_01735 [Luteibacter pinisoli]